MPSIPTDTTLKKYGLNSAEFSILLQLQGGVCAVCGRVPNGHWCIDHEHVKGWKHKPANERKRYVRGIVCWFCNHYYLGKGITVQKAENVVYYLKEYEERKRR